MTDGPAPTAGEDSGSVNGPISSLNIATWNTEWALPNSRRAETIRERLAAASPDIVCLTECHKDFLREWEGHVIEGGDEWGVGAEESRREVLLWSRWPWRDIDTTGSSSLPQGRYARAVTDTPLGSLTVIGVVIPYHFSNVRHGRRDRAPWQEHGLYLDALGPVLKSLGVPSIVLGDFNQRIPSKWVPRRERDKLATVFSEFSIITAGRVEFNGDRAIDHIACHPSLEAMSVGTLSNLADSARRLSDHFGVTSTLRRTAT